MIDDINKNNSAPKVINKIKHTDKKGSIDGAHKMKPAIPKPPKNNEEFGKEVTENI